LETRHYSECIENTWLSHISLLYLITQSILRGRSSLSRLCCSVKKWRSISSSGQTNLGAEAVPALGVKSETDPSSRSPQHNLLDLQWCV